MSFNNNNLLNQNYHNNYNLNMFNRINQSGLNQAQMMNMYQTMNNIKKMEQSKYLSKINELEKNRDRLQLDKDELRNAIIKPIKIDKNDKNDRQEIIIKYRDLENNFSNKELENLWNKRTNQGYKHIIKDERYQKKDYKKKEDLIIHKVTELDKIGVDNELKHFEETIETQNGELKIQYSQSKELEHKKKFEYNNKYKYAIKYNPKAHEELKDNNVEYFKQEQEKIEKDKKKIDDIMQSLIETNMLTEEEKKDLIDLDKEDDNKQDNNKQDIEIEKQDKTKPEKSVKFSKIVDIKEESYNSDSDKKSDNLETEKPEKRQIKITIKTKKVENKVENNDNKDNDILVNKLINDNKVIKDKDNEKMDVQINEDVRNKYLNRKKK